ncbi:MogA/MoaB family molybdenum cofactor biosynthesis protein [Halobiforma nitratireducens]|uniref:Molybdenum cofactor synthesis domain-containing protein n=1 Tax=Halobiforma nitratireducens JCM 10879 TaxID=1227454 RepID=M0M1Q0_9EURY|nr:molybdenum cofactor synthesis domain-containing protein [Halobiforma nitratireducens]EMA38330.1 molybdenum cofactor synthesis domain-containing protein [Halobiforma nitratireducens JCM 10879]
MDETDGDADGAANTDGDGDGDGDTASPLQAESEREPASSPTANPDSPLGFAVVTVATSRSLDSDAAGEAVETVLEDAGHELATREHVGSDHDRVQSIVLRIIERDDVDVVVTAGATSVEPDDVVIEAVEPLLDKELAAFQELFTMLAYEEVGTRVVASRTLAGVAEGKPVFCLPGNADAACLGTESIVLPEARHLVTIANGHEDGTEGDDGVRDESEES